jgi:[ribosomal protein S18]-alanine N-acetyltransferase
MAKTNIRYAIRADFPVLLEIDTSSFPEETAYDSTELSYFMSHNGAETIVLERAGIVEAFLIVDFDYRKKSATIVTLDVRGNCRRLGYGSKLLQRAEEIVTKHNIREFTLQVDVNNDGAIAFYEKHGFQITRKLNHYYPDGHDAWLMLKTLPLDDGK